MRPIRWRKIPEGFRARLGAWSVEVHQMQADSWQLFYFCGVQAYPTLPHTFQLPTAREIGETWLKGKVQRRHAATG